jgi:Icc-related predicted phosphoesterase
MLQGITSHVQVFLNTRPDKYAKKWTTRAPLEAPQTTMRIQLASDLHAEFLAYRFPRETGLTPAANADILVLAGDIANGTSALSLFKDWPVPVVYICGNHELYSQRYEDVFEELHRLTQGTSITFLERQVVDFGGVRVLGATLWTDYLLDGRNRRPEAMSNARRGLNDHRVITTRLGSAFTPTDALEDHEKSRAWLEAELARPYDGKTVVATHHGPHPKSVHAQYAGSDLNAGFVSDLSPLLRHVDLWVHGHVHNSFDYQVGRCRVVANPRGYPMNRGSSSTIDQLRFENPAFDTACVIDTSLLSTPTSSIDAA